MTAQHTNVAATCEWYLRGANRDWPIFLSGKWDLGPWDRESQNKWVRPEICIKTRLNYGNRAKWSLGHDRYSDMTPRLSGQDCNFLRFFCLSKKTLEYKKTTSNMDVCLQEEYWYIERSLFRLGHGIYTSGPQVKIKLAIMWRYCWKIYILKTLQQRWKALYSKFAWVDLTMLILLLTIL